MSDSKRWTSRSMQPASPCLRSGPDLGLEPDLVVVRLLVRLLALDECDVSNPGGNQRSHRHGNGARGPALHIAEGAGDQSPPAVEPAVVARLGGYELRDAAQRPDVGELDAGGLGGAVVRDRERVGQVVRDRHRVRGRGAGHGQVREEGERREEAAVREEGGAGLVSGGRVPENHLFVLQALAVAQGGELRWILFARAPANGRELDALCRTLWDERVSGRTVGLAQLVAVATVQRAR